MMSPGQTALSATELPTTESLSPDRQWLDRFVDHQDEAAFAALVQRHGPTVLRVCRGVLRDPHAVEDAFQATFLVLVRKAAAIRSRTSVGSWLYKVAYRISLAARAARTLRPSPEQVAPAKSETGPLAEITGRELTNALDEELAQMADRYRAPLMLCLLEGATRDEAAARLGWSLSTLKRRLERGREVLRARLARRGLALSAVLSAALLAQNTASAALPVVQAGVASTQARVLAEGALQALSWKSAHLVLGLLLLLGSAVGLSTWSWTSATPKTPQAQQPPAPRPNVDDPTLPTERKIPAYTTDRQCDPPPGLLPEKKTPMLI
jgi:RNA polymerase sigma factor (sigma-70 family)